ncbi:MAG: polysaccharide biosynthesis tyrosine autokinase [Elusimicrobia bacterium]|nr:polysaccharide biosynthesis tyrosine autokinase [Elusimicrobiota bacterium]
MIEAQDQEQALDLQGILAALSRRLWTILAVLIAALAGTGVYVFTAKPVYSASALILIEKEEKGRAYSETTVSEAKADDYYQTQYMLLRSRSLLKKVCENLELAKLPEFSGGVDSLAAAVSIIPVTRSRLVNIRADSFDPELAARISNNLAETYVAQNLENKLFIAKDILATLQEKIDKSSGMEEKYQALPSVVNNPVIQELKSHYAKLQAKLGDLSSRYTEIHPERVRLKSEMAAVQARIREETLRTVQVMKAELSGQLLGNNVRIVDPAEVPKLPSKPKKSRSLAIAGFFGLVLGCALALVLEHMDMSIRNQDDVEKKLGLPFLGSVTKSVKFHNAGARQLSDLMAGTESFTGEAFKNIRTMVGFAAADSKLRQILITSSVQGEGKTFLTMNLAMVFAQLGQKVLLIEGDMRRPNIHKTFALSKEKGLSHFLAHGRDIHELESHIQDTGFPNLKALVCGMVPPNPSELLSTPKLKAILDWAGKNYDQVFVDGTPVFPITDALLWGRLMDGAIFVCQHGGVHMNLALKAKQKLVDGGIKIIGCVLNKVVFGGRGYGYYDKYYHYYHYYHYGYGPDKKDKKARAEKKPDLV